MSGIVAIWVFTTGCNACKDFKPQKLGEVKQKYIENGLDVRLAGNSGEPDTEEVFDRLPFMARVLYHPCLILIPKYVYENADMIETKDILSTIHAFYGIVNVNNHIHPIDLDKNCPYDIMRSRDYALFLKKYISSTEYEYRNRIKALPRVKVVPDMVIIKDTPKYNNSNTSKTSYSTSRHNKMQQIYKK